MLVERQFTTGTVTLNYAEGSEAGPPLVLIHGLSYRWQNWLSVMPGLALRWQLYALDLRGFGRSGRVPGAYRAIDYAGDIIDFLRGVVRRPTVLVGHSLGAIATIDATATAPGLVRAVVLEEPPLGLFTDQSLRETPVYEPYRRMHDLALEQPTFVEAVEKLGSLLPGVSPVEVRSRAVALIARDPEAIGFFIEDRAKEGLDLERSLRGIMCPVLLIRGNEAHGGAVDDTRATWALSLLSSGTLVSLPNVGHFIHDAIPDQFARLVTDFLETLA